MATGNFGTAAAADVVKSQYNAKQAFQVLAAKSPILNLIAKKPGVIVGKDFSLSVQYGSGRGVATQLAAATGSKSTSLYKTFLLKRGRLYGKGGIDRETMMAAKTNEAAFVDAIVREQDGVLASMKERMQQFLYGNGGGAAGRIATGGISGSTITLANRNDVRYFQQDGRYELSANDGNTGTIKAGAALVCQSVDRLAGTVTFTAGVVATVATAAALDYVFAVGDHAAVYADAVGPRVLYGLESWVPRTAPTATLFAGVDRSVDPVRLGGCRFQGNGGPIQETVELALAEFANQGADECDTIIMNPVRRRQLIVSLGDQCTYNSVTSPNTKLSFKGVSFASESGDLSVLGDPACPMDVAYALKMSTWSLLTMGGFPEIVSPDGLTLRQASDGSDNWEWIYSGFGQLACEAPGKNGVIILLGGMVKSHAQRRSQLTALRDQVSQPAGARPLRTLLPPGRRRGRQRKQQRPRLLGRARRNGWPLHRQVRRQRAGPRRGRRGLSGRLPRRYRGRPRDAGAPRHRHLADHERRWGHHRLHVPGLQRGKPGRRCRRRGGRHVLDLVHRSPAGHHGAERLMAASKKGGAVAALFGSDKPKGSKATEDEELDEGEDMEPEEEDEEDAEAEDAAQSLLDAIDAKDTTGIVEAFSRLKDCC